MSEVICLSSGDEDGDKQSHKVNDNEIRHNTKRKRISPISVDRPAEKRPNMEICSAIPTIKDTEGEDCEVVGIVAKVDYKPVLVVKEKLPVHASNGGQDVFSMFLGQCLLRDRSGDMKKIVEKLKRRYEQLDTQYAQSNEFAELLNDKRNHLMAETGLIYGHIAEIMNEMKARKKGKDVTIPSCSSLKGQCAHIVTNDENEEDGEAARKRDRKIRAIEKAMSKVEQRIKKYEESEVDFEDDDNSTFLITDRFKSRMVELYNKWCELTGNLKDAGRTYLRPIHLKLTGIVTVDQAINSFINSNLAKKTNPSKKSPSTPNTLIFPDYVDILKLLHTHNITQNLGMDAKAEKATAKAAFIKLGEYLKSVRQRDFYDTFSTMYEEADDPASKHEDLMKKLRDNRDLGEKNMNAIFDEYSKKQEVAKSLGIVDELNFVSDKEDEEEEDEDEDEDEDAEEEDGDVEEEEKDEEDEENEEDLEESDDEKIDDDDDKRLENDPEPIAISDENDGASTHLSSKSSEVIKNSVQAEINEVEIQPLQIENFTPNLTDETCAGGKPILKLRSFAKPPGFWQNSQDNKEQNSTNKLQTLADSEPDIIELDVIEKRIPQVPIVTNNIKITKPTEISANVLQKLLSVPLKSTEKDVKIFRRLMTIPMFKLTPISSQQASQANAVQPKQTCSVPLSAIEIRNQKTSRPVAHIVGQRKVTPASPMTPIQDIITIVNPKFTPTLCINPIAKGAQVLTNISANPSTATALVETLPIMASNKTEEYVYVKTLPQKVINPLVKQRNIENMILTSSNTECNKNVSHTVGSSNFIKR